VIKTVGLALTASLKDSSTKHQVFMMMNQGLNNSKIM